MGGKRGTIARCKRCRSLSALYPAAQVTRAAEHGFYRILSIHEISADSPENRGGEGSECISLKTEGWVEMEVVASLVGGRKWMREFYVK